MQKRIQIFENGRTATWLGRLAVALICLVWGTAGLWAATLHWTGGGNGTEWSTGNGSGARNNWGGTAFGNNDNAVFGGTSFLSPTIGNNALSVGSITFTNNAGTFNIAGSATLTVASGITNLSSSNQIFSVAIALGAAQTWNSGTASGGRLTFSNNVNLGASRTLTLDGANNILLNGVLSGTGTSGLVKNGTGTAVLAGANTFTGDVVINAGTLRLDTNAPSGAAGALGNSTSTVLLGATSGSSSATLELTNGVTVGRNLQVRAGSSGVETIGATGTAPATVSGNVDLRTDIQLSADSGSDLSMTGVLSSPANVVLTKVGAGTVRLSGVNTFTGDVIINAGTLLLATNALSGAAGALGNSTSTVLLGATNGSASTTLQLTNGITVARNIQVRAGSSGVVTISASGTAPATVSGNVDLRFDVQASAGTGSDLSFTGVLSSPGDITFTKVGAGTVRLSGANTFTGTVRVDAGTLLLGASERIANGVALRLNGGTFGAAGFTETLGTLTLTANSIIDLGGSTSVLKLSNSSGQSWTGGTSLTVQNWNGSLSGGGSESIQFGNSTSGLSSGQLSQISFLNPQGLAAGSYAARILSSGEVVPVPEPATGFAAGALVTLVAFREGRVRRPFARILQRLRLAVMSETGVRNLVMLGFALLLYLAVCVLP